MSLPDQVTLNRLLAYDPITGTLTWKYRPREFFETERSFKAWNSTYAGKEAFTAVDRKGYNVGAIFGVNYRCHRVIFKMVYGVDPDQVDHEDGDPQNNRLINLRDVSGQQNQMNMKRSKANRSGVTGVRFDTNRQKWTATIGVDGKTRNLGRFDTMEEAVQARQQAEVQYGFHPNHGR